MGQDTGHEDGHGAPAWVWSKGRGGGTHGHHHRHGHDTDGQHLDGARRRWEPPQDGTDQHRSTGPQGCRAPMAADGRR